MEKKRRNKWIIFISLGVVCLISGVLAAGILLKKKEMQEKPENLLKVYMNYISEKEYDKMYEMINLEKSANISQENFVTRNSKIYEGIEMQNMKIENVKEEVGEKGIVTLTYHTVFDTMAGTVEFENKADFAKKKEGYALIWKDSLIHPDLETGDKMRITTSQAKRGNILDRNGTVMAGEGIASSVGVVPGKLVDKQSALSQISALLETDIAVIQKKLEAGWVKEDSFVPLKTISKVLEEKETQDQLLAIPGVMISDVGVREYPLKEAASHLIGYVQNITEEDLKQHESEGYNANSVIGKSGMEGLYEKELKGQNGCEIYISDTEGNKKTVLACILQQDGENVQLTIDATAQMLLYEQFQEDKSCTAAMNPYTGEVLALISTPSFNNNDFIIGMSDEKWTSLNEDKNQPMYNRFRQVWCPGSVFKPIIGAIGLKTGAIDPDEDYGNVGLSWQKDSSWGSYFVTTLHAYEPVILENALIYSDNIYFAKAAIKIGMEHLTASFDELGFNQEMPFEITLKKSQYSNTDTMESEVQLADSGYGQAQILVNPVHLASIYTAFVNNGNAIKPYLLYSGKGKKEVWIPEVFPMDAAGKILEGMKKVVNDPNGTGYSAHSESIQLAGKTGTAEIKASKDDTTGTELGWFAVFTTDQEMQKPILIVSMAEDVKEIGGSGYVVKKVKNMLDMYMQE